MQQMQNINSKQILWDSMYFYITVSYFSIYFPVSHIYRSADLLIIMLYANVHILDINISEKCQKRKDMPSSSSMQPRKHASRLTTKRKPSLFRSPKVTLCY